MFKVMYGYIFEDKIKFVVMVVTSAFLFMGGCSDIDNIVSSENFKNQSPFNVRGSQDVGDIDRTQPDKMNKIEEDSASLQSHYSYGDGV